MRLLERVRTPALRLPRRREGPLRRAPRDPYVIPFLSSPSIQSLLLHVRSPPLSGVGPINHKFFLRRTLQILPDRFSFSPFFFCIFVFLYFCILFFFFVFLRLRIGFQTPRVIIYKRTGSKFSRRKTNVHHRIGSLAHALGSFYSLCFLTLSLSLLFVLFFFRFARNDFKEKNLIPLRITVVSSRKVRAAYRMHEFISDHTNK